MLILQRLQRGRCCPQDAIIASLELVQLIHVTSCRQLPAMLGKWGSLELMGIADKSKGSKPHHRG